MTIDAATLLTFGLPLAGGLIWLIRLEGRVNMNERRTDELHDDISEIKKDVKALLQRSYGARAGDFT